MTVVGWVDTEDPRLPEVFPDAGGMSPETLALVLNSAYVQCAEFAPALAPDATPPENWVHAQMLQASELFSASRREGDVMGFEDTGITIRVRPLTTTVKSLLRPRRGRPVVG